MLNQNFLKHFTQHFVEQVVPLMPIDGYLVYSIEHEHHAHNFQPHNLYKGTLTEYLTDKVNDDPVSYQRFYGESDATVKLLSEHTCNARYTDFMTRWQVTDTAEIFFRKRNGEPIVGLSMVREKNQPIFSGHDKKILQSFYHLSQPYFFQHVDTVDAAFLSSAYRLTKKEITVAELLIKGLNNQLIAEKLHCSLATIKTHVQHIYQKIGVNNRQEMFYKFLT